MAWLTPETVSALGATGAVLTVLVFGIVKHIRDEQPRAAADAHFRAALEDARGEIRRLTAEVQDLRAAVNKLTSEVSDARTEGQLWQRRAFEAGWQETPREN